MPGLLVSVRSASEARAAIAGGAAIVDVKEPARGPLGRANANVWSEVRRVVPRDVPVSVALGELDEAESWAECSAWCASGGAIFQGVAYCKLGLARSGRRWAERWRALREHLGPGPAWVAVAYVDWRFARAPDPEEVIDEAIASECAGVLIDTWDKTGRRAAGPDLAALFARARRSGLFVALAGGLDEADIRRLQPLEPDYFAVRGAACTRGDRRATIDRSRVARLAVAAARGAESTAESRDEAAAIRA